MITINNNDESEFIHRTTLAAGSAALLSGCGGSGNAQADTLPAVTLGPVGTTFWDVFAPPAPGAKPGDVLHAQARLDAPTGSKGWNVVYVSEVAAGRLAYVSGEIYIPTGTAAGARDVVLWNHETTGLQDSCAPSRRSLDQGDHSRVPALQEMLGKGYVVVMSDYPGQGLPGPTMYMAGQPNARASLDMLRVAQRFPEANASKRYVMYGWSQGGQTTMWAESIASNYVPEFTGLGAGLIAPAVRIKDLTLNSMKSPANAGYVISTLPGIKAYMPELKYSDFLTTEGTELFPVMTSGCFDVWAAGAGLTAPYQPGALVEGSPWWNAMTAVDNFTPKGTMPFVIYQGGKDVDVPASLTERERAALCKAGSKTEYNAFANLDHIEVVAPAAAQFPAWAEARFKGQAANSNCPG